MSRFIQGELEFFHRCPYVPASVGTLKQSFDEWLAKGMYRPEWTFVAMSGDEVVGRIAFWGPPDSEHPFHLDYFDFDTVETGAALLRHAYGTVVTGDYRAPVGPRPTYELFLRDGWDQAPGAEDELRVRREAAEKGGLTFLRERLNLKWLPEYGLPERSTRLTFTPADDDELLLELLSRIVVGSLDVSDQQELLTKPPRLVAGQTLEEVASMPGGRSRWRLGHHEGEPVGVVMGTRNPGSATIGYIGVDPAHRGNGYAFDLLAEAMHLFAEEGEPQIGDATDLGNTPMAAVFDRAGYRVTGRIMVFI